MDFDSDKYDLFNAPQYVDFNEFVRNDGFRDDNADDFFETHREEDDFFPAEALSPTAQLLLNPSDILILHQEGPKSSVNSPAASSVPNENKPKYHTNEHYHGTGMSMSPSPMAMPRPTSSDMIGSSNQVKATMDPGQIQYQYECSPIQCQSHGQGESSGNGTRYYYPISADSKQHPEHPDSCSHYLDDKDFEVEAESQKGQKKCPIKLTCSEEAIMNEETVKTKSFKTTPEKARRIAELEQLEKARIKAELEKAEKLRIQAELEKSEKLRIKLELENAEKARLEAEIARREKMEIQAELERVEKARKEAEEKAEKAKIEAEMERQEKARIQAELEKLEKDRQEHLLHQHHLDLQALKAELEEVGRTYAVEPVASPKLAGYTINAPESPGATGDQRHDSKGLGYNYEKSPNQNQLGQACQEPALNVESNPKEHPYTRSKHYYYHHNEPSAHPDYCDYKSYTVSQEKPSVPPSDTHTSRVTFKEPASLKRSHNRVTVPQPFKFTELKPRKPQEVGVDTFRFKARPAPLKAIHGESSTSGNLKVKPMQCTQPTEFHFASEDRIRERNLKRKSQPNQFTKKEGSVSPGMGRRSRIGRGSIPIPVSRNQNQNQTDHGSPNKQQKQSQNQLCGSMSRGNSTETVGSVASVDSSNSQTTITGSNSTVGMDNAFRKLRIRSRSSSVERGQRGVSPGPTTVKPFSFEERNREMLKKKDEKIRNAIRADIPLRTFHAQKIPNYTLSLRRLPKKNPAPPTNVEPFVFKCDQRGSAYQEEIQRKAQEEMVKLKQQAEFTAQPNEVIYKKPFEPEKSGLPLIEPLDIILNSDRRADDRAKFDSMIKEKEAELNELRKQDKYLKEEQEMKLSQALRQMCVHRAKPAPKTRFFEIKSSDKPLTEPRSPAFELLPSQRRPRNHENKENVK